MSEDEVGEGGEEGNGGRRGGEGGGVMSPSSCHRTPSTSLSA